jgi:long-subunit fatty acid transport protein
MRRAALVGLALLTWAGRAGADPYQVSGALLGARASGIGGAATGLPEEDAAPFYNPAAISLDPRISVSFSAQALQLQSRTFSPYLGSRATETQAGLVPNASVGSFPWRGGRASFAVFTTQQENLTLNQTLHPPAETGVATARLRRLENDSTYLLGPSYGRPVNDVLAVGFSVLYVYRSLSQRADEYAEASNPQTNPAAISHALDDEGLSQGLAFVGGLRLRPGGSDGRLTVGLTLRSAVALSQQQVRREERYIGTRDAGGVLRFSREQVHDESASARAGLPAAILTGASLRLGPTLLSAQASFTSAQKDFTPGVDGRFTANGALGAELHIDPVWTARAGLFARRSAVADPQTAPQLDQYGVSVGTGWVELHHVTDVALVVISERGQAPVETVTGGRDLVQVTGYTLLLTLGGAFRF